MENVYFIRIRAMLKTNVNESFTAKVSQSSNGENEQSKIFFVIAIIMALCVIIIVALVLISICFKKKHRRENQRREQQRRERRQNQAQINHENRAARVYETMAKMNHGKFSELQMKYSQDTCVICLEEFRPDSLIHFTNE